MRRLLASFVSCFALLGTAAGAQTDAPATAAGPATIPLSFQLSAKQIASDCSAQVADARAAETALVRARSARTFESVVVPLENLSSDLNDRLASQTFLSAVAVEKGVRDASLACNSKESAAFNEISADPQLYHALETARASGTAQTVYDRKLLSLWETALVRSGAALDAPRRATFVRLSNRLNDLGNAFGDNLANDATTIVATADELRGLPPDVLGGLKRGSGGAYVVPVNESTVSLFLNNVRAPAVRRRYYLAYNNRAVAKNLTVLREALVVRSQLAHLLGFPSWDAYQLADRMPKTLPHLRSFLDDLQTRVAPLARADVAELATLKAADLHVASATIDPWDVGYYEHALLRTHFAVDENVVRQYFPVQHTIDTVLAIYSKLLGLSFSAVPDAPVWAPGVLRYDVADAHSQAYVGTFYLDLYPRPGKFEHFENVPILPVRRLADGTMRPPVSAILGNWPKPGGGSPAVLSHDDVETFFHEFGHNMAALLATAPYETLTNGFRFDFVEAPSQMLENFVWDRSVLEQLSSNVTTGAPLPGTLIDKMIAARYVDYAYSWERQLMFASIDLDYHDVDPHVDTTAIWRREAAKTPVPMPPGVHPQAAFGHLFGYDAGYYAYTWAKVYAQDMFTAFRDGGIENPAVGKRYREDILAPARTYEPDVLVEHFLGRPMNPNTFLSEFSHDRAAAQR